jgi:hypothetical protein
LILLISTPLFIPPILLILGRYINIYYYISIIWISFITNPQPLNSLNISKNIILLITLISSSLIFIMICGLNIYL